MRDKMPLIHGFEADLSFLSETKLRDTSFIGPLASQLYDGRPFLANRQRQEGAVPQGGVGFWLNDTLRRPRDRLRARVDRSEHKGLITLVVQQRQSKPLPIIGVYMVPLSSPQNTNGKSWRSELFATLSEEIARVRAKYGQLLIVGDFNAQLGNSNQHCTADSHGPSPDLMALVRQHNLVSLFGHPELAPAFCTSKPICGRTGPGSESDYIFCTGELDLTNVQFLGHIPHEGWESSSHCPLRLEIRLTPLGMTHAPIKPQVLPRVPRPPAYLDERYHTFQSKLIAAIRAPLQLTQSRGLDEQFQAVQTSLASAISTHFSTTPPAHNWRHGRPSLYRSYKGIKLPGSTVTLLAEIRHLRHRLSNRSNAPETRMQLATDIRRLTKEVRKCTRQEHRKVQARFRRFTETVRWQNPHGWHKLQRSLAPPDHRITRAPNVIPDNRDGRPAVETFTEHHEILVREMRTEPPAISDPGAMAFCPVAPEPKSAAWNSCLAASVSAELIFHLLFNVSSIKRRDNLSHVEAVHAHPPGCKLCAHIQGELDAWDDTDPDSKAPTLFPTLHTSTGTGPDGISAEYLRWTRNSAPKERYKDRMELCTLLAQLFNRMLAEGRVPTETFAESRTIALLKKAMPGIETDPADPNNYRGITMGNLLPKVFSLILDARLLHWAVDCDIIGPEQVAFLPLQGAEHHVFTVLETIKHQWRHGKNVFALFVDFKKAYDMVHQSALWQILARAGIPDNVLMLLRNWHSVRTTCMNVNGESSRNFTYDKGVPQGEVTSCILFIIFIESLVRYLKSQPGLSGIRLASRSRDGKLTDLVISALLYADDVLILADTPAELQTALDCICKWAKSWHFELGIGNGKTEAMAFLCPASLPRTPQSAATSPPAAVTRFDPLPCCFGTVNWVQRYRYLGHDLRWNLSTEGLIAKRVAHLKKLLLSHFTFNRTVRGMSVCGQLQLLTTLIQGSVNYLFSTVTFTKADFKKLDTCIFGAARRILGLPKCTPLPLVCAESGLPPVECYSVMHRERLRWSLKLTPFTNSIAAQLLSALELAAENRAPKGSGISTSWVHATNRATETMVALGALWDHPRHYAERSHRLAVLFRSSAYILWRKALTCTGASVVAQDGRAVYRNSERQAALQHRPPPHPPIQHISALFFRAGATPAAAHGTGRLLVPLSYIGPKGGYGVGASTVMQRRHVAVSLAKLGSAALNMYPFTDNRRQPHTAGVPSYPGELEQAAATPASPDTSTIVSSSCSSSGRSSPLADSMSSESLTSTSWSSTPSNTSSDTSAAPSQTESRAPTSPTTSLRTRACDNPSADTGLRPASPSADDHNVPDSISIASSVSSAFPLPPSRSQCTFERRRNPLQAVHCKFCNDSFADVRHLLSECKAEHSLALRALQRSTQASAQSMLLTIAAEIEAAAKRLESQYPDLSAGLTTHSAALTTAIHTGRLNWRSHDGRFLLHRLVLVLTYSDQLTDPVSMPVSHLLGQLFQASVVPRCHARRLFTKWTNWAATTIHNLAALWRSPSSLHCP